MKSEKVRALADDSAKKAYLTQSKKFKQEVTNAIAQETDLFLKYLTYCMTSSALKGQLVTSCKLYKSCTSSNFKPVIEYGKNSIFSYLLDEMLDLKNNSQLDKWIDDNDVYLTVIGPKTRFRPHWTVNIDCRQHSKMYQNWRKLFFGNSHYRLSVWNHQEMRNILRREAHRLGVEVTL